MKSIHKTANGNTAVALTFKGTSPVPLKLLKVIWSYSAAPTGGKLTITDKAVTVLEVDIIAGGPGWLPLCLESFNDVVITLAAGSGSVIGKLNVETIPAN